MRYMVQRHGGNTSHSWRLVKATDDGDTARQVYEDIALTLRQGAVRLLIDGTVANQTAAPRVRTRW